METMFVLLQGMKKARTLKHAPEQGRLNNTCCLNIIRYVMILIVYGMLNGCSNTGTKTNVEENDTQIDSSQIIIMPKGTRIDTIILGYTFGMSSDEFMSHTMKLSARGLLDWDGYIRGTDSLKFIADILNGQIQTLLN